MAALVDTWLSEALPCLLGFSFPDRVSATTLRKALDLLRFANFDAAVVDLGLPDAHGVQAVVAIAAAAPDLPIVVLTGDEMIGRQALASGADSLVKPGTIDLPLRLLLPHAISESVLRRKRHSVKQETIASLRALANAPWFTPPEQNGFASTLAPAALAVVAAKLLMLAL